LVALVQEQRGVMGVDPVEREGGDARPPFGFLRSEEVEARLAAQGLGELPVERHFPRTHLGRVEPGQILDGRPGSDDPCVVLEPGLETVRRGPELVVRERAPLHRFPAEKEGSEGGEGTGSGGENPGTGGA